jgi:hypothetical protein
MSNPDPCGGRCGGAAHPDTVRLDEQGKTICMYGLTFAEAYVQLATLWPPLEPITLEPDGATVGRLERSAILSDDIEIGYEKLADQHGSKVYEGVRRDGLPGKYHHFTLDQIRRLVIDVRERDCHLWLRFARHLDHCPRKGNAFDAQRDPNLCTCGLASLAGERE